MTKKMTKKESTKEESPGARAAKLCVEILGTQMIVAKKAGVTQGSVSKWVAGISIPRAKAIYKLELATGRRVRQNDWFE